jgi:hypothetical protein
MSSLAQTFVSWEAFLELPDPSNTGNHYELHDGEVVEVSASRFRHVKQQKQVEAVLQGAAAAPGIVKGTFPYRPAANLQYWVADVTFIPQEDCRRP